MITDLAKWYDKLYKTQKYQKTNRDELIINKGTKTSTRYLDGVKTTWELGTQKNPQM